MLINYQTMQKFLDQNYQKKSNKNAGKVIWELLEKIWQRLGFTVELAKKHVELSNAVQGLPSYN